LAAAGEDRGVDGADDVDELAVEGDFGAVHV
jgi:hypothetical protein